MDWKVIPKVVFRPSKLWKFLVMLFHLQFYPDKTLEAAAFHHSKIRVWKLELELHWVAVIQTTGYIYQAIILSKGCSFQLVVYVQWTADVMFTVIQVAKLL